MKRPIIKATNGKTIKEGDHLLDKAPVDEDDDSKGTYSFKWPVLWHNNEWCIDNSFKQDGSSIVSMVGYFGCHLVLVEDEK